MANRVDAPPRTPVSRISELTWVSRYLNRSSSPGWPVRSWVNQTGKTAFSRPWGVSTAGAVAPNEDIPKALLIFEIQRFLDREHVDIAEKQRGRVEPVGVGRRPGRVARVTEVVDDVPHRKPDTVGQVILGSAGRKSLVFGLPVLKRSGKRRRLRESPAVGSGCRRLRVGVREATQPHCTERGRRGRICLGGGVQPYLNLPTRF